MFARKHNMFTYSHQEMQSLPRRTAACAHHRVKSSSAQRQTAASHQVAKTVPVIIKNNHHTKKVRGWGLKSQPGSNQAHHQQRHRPKQTTTLFFHTGTRNISDSGFRLSEPSGRALRNTLSSCRVEDGGLRHCTDIIYSSIKRCILSWCPLPHGPTMFLQARRIRHNRCDTVNDASF